MLNENILKILKENHQILESIKQMENFEVLIKKLSYNELKNLKLYYPDFINIDINSETDVDNQNLNQKDSSIIFCFTFVKNENSKKYEKIKKIKIYVDELKEVVLKILQN